MPSSWRCCEAPSFLKKKRALDRLPRQPELFDFLLRERLAAKETKVNGQLNSQTYLRRVVVDVLDENVDARKCLSKWIVHLADLNLQAKRRIRQFLKIYFANEEEFAGLRVHLEEAALVAEHNAVPEPRVNSSVLVVGNDCRLDAHLFADALALSRWSTC